MKKLPPFVSQVRNYTAVISAFIYNLNVFGISAKNICSPGFNCHGCPWATFSCPVGIIGYGFGVRSIPAFAIGSVLAIGIVLGRLVCGYACPFGLFQEILFRIKTKKFSLPTPIRYLKYIIMVLFVFVLTFLFGFEVEEGYIKIEKPIIAKDDVTLDTTIFAEKNWSYFGGKDLKPNTVTKGGFPVPDDFFKVESKSVESGAGLKPIGVKASSGAFGLEEIVTEIEPYEGSSDTADIFNVQSNEKTVGSGLKSIGVQKSSAGVGLGDILSDVNDETNAKPLLAPVLKPEKSLASTGSESVFDFLERSKEDALKNAELLTEITISNPSEHPVNGFTLIPVFYSNETGEEMWRGDEKVYSDIIEPAGSFTTEIFKVPYYLHKADFAVLSPQTSVVQNYWTLFCTYCPVAVLEADLPGEIADIEDFSQIIYATTRMNSFRLALAVFVIIGCVFISRFFCRGFCPLGAMYGVFARYALLKVVVDKDTCINCGKCDEVCPVELDVRNEVGGSECIACGDCIRSCPKGSIKRRVGLK